MASLNITPCLWFDTQGEQAAEFYCSVFPNSKVKDVARYGPDMPGPEGQAMTVDFEIDGNPFVALNGGPEFTFSEAVSFQIFYKDQAEVDHYWSALLADGGEESQCGWLRDKFGLSWQVIPTRLMELIDNPGAMQAMLKMRKIDIAELERAVT